MTPKVEVARPGMPVWEAANIMRHLNVGSLPVCEGTRVIGMVTDRDITVRITADALDPRATRVGQCMSVNPVYCFADQDSVDAELIMQEARVRRLPVLDRSLNLVGIVSLGDLATRTVETEETERTLWKVSLPFAPRPDGSSAAESAP